MTHEPPSWPQEPPGSDYPPSSYPPSGYGAAHPTSPGGPPQPQAYPAPYPAGAYPAGAYPAGGHAPGAHPPGAYPPPPQGWPQSRSTNGMAIAAMVVGILWLYWLGSVAALVLGYIAREQIRRSGEAGDGMAIAGIVLGWIGVGTLFLTMTAVLLT